MTLTWNGKKFEWVNVAYFGAIHAGALFAPFQFSWTALGAFFFLYWLSASIGICAHLPPAADPPRLRGAQAARVPAHRRAACSPAKAARSRGWRAIASTTRCRTARARTSTRRRTASGGATWAGSSARWTSTTRRSRRSYAPELVADPVHRFLNKVHILPNILLGLVFYAVGGWPLVVWGIFVRLVVGLHATWFVNSAAHTFGYRTYDTPEGSTNCWWVGLVAWGEGWHNNHHAFQRSARHGHEWWEVDATWVVDPRPRRARAWRRTSSSCRGRRTSSASIACGGRASRCRPALLDDAVVGAPSPAARRLAARSTEAPSHWGGPFRAAPGASKVCDPLCAPMGSRNHRRGLVLFAPLLLAVGLVSANEPRYWVVVHPDNPNDALSPGRGFEALPQEDPRGGSDGTERGARRPAREVGGPRRLLAGRPRAPAGAIKKYWQQKVFSGEAAPPPEVATEADVLAQVRSDPAAVGYVSDEAVLQGVKILDIVDPRPLPGRTPVAESSAPRQLAMLENLKFSQKLLLMPAVAGIAFVLIVVMTYWAGASNARLTLRIERGHSARPSSSGATWSHLEKLQRGPAGLGRRSTTLEMLKEHRRRRATRSSPAAHRARSNPSSTTTELSGIESALWDYYSAARPATERMIDGRDRAAAGRRPREDAAGLQPAARARPGLHREASARRWRRPSPPRASNHRRSMAAIAGITLLCLIALGTLSYSVTRSLTTQLTEAVRVANDVAAGPAARGRTRHLPRRGGPAAARACSTWW